MGMSRGAWSDDMSVILKASSWKNTDTVAGYWTLRSNYGRSKDGRRLAASLHVTEVTQTRIELEQKMTEMDFGRKFST